MSVLRRRARRGMTLIEITVVLAILAIVAGVTVPAIASTAPLDPLRASADQVAALLGAARETALERGVRVTLTIDPASMRWWSDVPDTSDVLALSDGVALVSDVPRVHVAFDAAGEAAADPMSLRLGDRTVPIAVDRWTGEVQRVTP